MELTKDDSFTNVLLKLKGQSVDIILKNGQTRTGKIKLESDFFIQVERQDSKSFYDSIIRNEDISAVEMKVRS